MVDFSQLLDKPAGEAKRPKALPIGDYDGMIKGFEPGDANRNKTPYVRFTFVLTGWPQTVMPDEQIDIDLTKRTLRRDFYLTEESMWRFDNFIKSCGIDPRGQTYAELLPMMISQPVVIQVQHYLNQQTNDIMNTVGEVVGKNGSLN